MRLVLHNGRRGKDGAYSAKHNDRNFEGAEHIDQSRSNQNRYMRLISSSKNNEENEKEVYEKLFKKHLETKNRRYEKNRHKEKIQTMEEYRKNVRTCPEETIYQIGSVKDHASPEKLWEVYAEYRSWHTQQYPNVLVVDAALHMDEATPHIHERKIWISHDKEGHPMVNQEGALREMGVKAPNVNKKDRYNNAKMTYTATCRTKFEEICQTKGINLETERKEASETGKTLLQYKVDRDKATEEKLKATISSLQAEIGQKASEYKELEKNMITRINSLKNEITSLQRDKDKLAGQKEKYEGYLSKTKKRLKHLEDTIYRIEDMFQRYGVPCEDVIALQNYVEQQIQAYKDIEEDLEL